MWGGYAYGRGLDGRPARDGDGDGVQADRGRREEHGHPRARHRRLRRLLPVPRRHGGHGPRPARHRPGGVHRRLDPPGDGPAPAPWSRRPRASSAPAWSTRKWIEAMRRHGYKGAFELAATVDYLFGYDATTGVVADWMYDKLTETYVLDPDEPRLPRGGQPLGPARHRRAPAGGRVARHVGEAGPADPRIAAPGLPGHRGRPGGRRVAHGRDGSGRRRRRPGSASGSGGPYEGVEEGLLCGVLVGGVLGVPLDGGEPAGRAGSSSPSTVPSAARAVTSSPSPSRSTRWWW